MRLRVSLLVSGLLATIFVAPSHALEAKIESAPAPFVNLYKSTGGNFVNDVSPPKAFSIDKQSQFVINFNTVPDTYKPAIQAAIDVWSQNFKSSVPINVDVNFERDQNNAVLAAASPGRFFSGFQGAPDNQLWYASAMANALAGKDLDPVNPEINIRINSTNGLSLYLGTDGACPQNQFDLESIILHEMAHGLGFLSNAEYDSNFNIGTLQQPTPYDAYAQLPDGRRLMDVASPSVELGQAMTNTLLWSGAKAIAANGGVKPKLYTPSPFEYGSSISHLDENTYPRGTPDSVMTPNLANGEVFHSPGPIAVAMLQDMMIKPPPGTPIGIPQVPQNVTALVGDKSAVVNFDPPINARAAQVTSYNIHVTPGDIDKQVTDSPATITGLKNGIAYKFTLTATNPLGTSPEATSNAVTPQANWASTVIDPQADALNLTQGTYKGNPIVIYSDGKEGLLKMATYVKNKWQISVIDGDAIDGGKTTDNVTGYVSMCTARIGTKDYLDVIYADLTEKDLRSAEFNGTNWKYSVVDGNGDHVQDYKEPNRVRTASDVTVSSACVHTQDGLQVFYRDQSQGILLGAEQVKNNWQYEIVDGDQTLNDRTTGDVGFHLKALNIGTKVYVAYDSVLSVNFQNKAIRGEIRLATRNSANPQDWTYKSVETFGGDTAVVGYDVSLALQGNKIYGAWLTGSGFTIPDADQIGWGAINPVGTAVSAKTSDFGAPTAPVAIGDKYILFNCASRLCAISRANKTISLVSSRNYDSSVRSDWITLNKVRYALVGSNGKLTLFKQP